AERTRNSIASNDSAAATVGLWQVVTKAVRSSIPNLSFESFFYVSDNAGPRVPVTDLVPPVDYRRTVCAAREELASRLVACVWVVHKIDAGIGLPIVRQVVRGETI